MRGTFTFSIDTGFRSAWTRNAGRSRSDLKPRYSVKGAIIRSSEHGGVIRVGHGVSATPGATVWVAVRPEKIQISKGEPGGVQNVVRGRVKDVAYLGDMSVYLVQIDSGKVLRVTRSNVFRNLEDRIGADETVYLSWHVSSPIVLTQ